MRRVKFISLRNGGRGVCTRTFSGNQKGRILPKELRNHCPVVCIMHLTDVLLDSQQEVKLEVSYAICKYIRLIKLTQHKIPVLIIIHVRFFE
jgi:hypothetical protein